MNEIENWKETETEWASYGINCAKIEVIDACGSRPCLSIVDITATGSYTVVADCCCYHCHHQRCLEMRIIRCCLCHDPSIPIFKIEYNDDAWVYSLVPALLHQTLDFGANQERPLKTSNNGGKGKSYVRLRSQSTKGDHDRQRQHIHRRLQSRPLSQPQTVHNKRPRNIP